MQSYITTFLGALGTGLAAYTATHDIVSSVAAGLAFAAGHLIPSPLSPKP